MTTASANMGDPVKKAQIDAYMKWVNVQLKKVPGLGSVKTLETDLCDGTHLANLIYVVAGEQLPVTQSPETLEDKLENLELILQFMHANHIRMHTISAEDVVNGDIKAIMRVILALAAHYKPNSVKQSSHGPQNSITGIAQGAAAALANARKDMAESSPTYSAKIAGGQGRPENIDRWLKDHNSSMASGDNNSIHTQSHSIDLSATATTADMSGSSQAFEEEMFDELNETRSALLHLQQLLLDQEKDEASEMTAGDTEEELCVVKRQLVQLEEAYQQTAQQLSQARQEGIQMQGIKTGLQNRLAEQENSLLMVKAELLRSGFTIQSLESSKAEAEKQLQERERIITELRKELVKKDRELDELKIEDKRRESANRVLKSQVSRMNAQLDKVAETEAKLSSRLAAQDRKMARLKDQLDLDKGLVSHGGQNSGNEELQTVKNSIHTLRSQFHTDEPQHQAVNQLELYISQLLDRLQLSEPPREPTRPAANTNSGSIHNSSSTKLLYFTEKNVTPCMVTIHKRLGQVTLTDVKNAIDRADAHRYFFKSMDPEFGAVKEEVHHDSEIVPGWEGKIVAYLEDDI